MKNLFYHMLMLAVMAASPLLLSSCEETMVIPPKQEEEKPDPEKDKGSEDDKGPTLPAPSVAGFAALHTKALADLKVEKKFKAQLPFEHTTGKGLYVTLGPGLQKPDGKATTGDADFALIEIYDRGNMAVANRPLMGKDTKGGFGPLVTGGQFFLEVKQNNQHLSPIMRGYGFEIPVSFTGGFDAAMELWQITTTNTAWTQMAALVDMDKKTNGTGSVVGYKPKITASTFGWTSLGKFFDHKGSKTKVKVRVPEGYNGENAALYLAYENESRLLGRLGVYDANDKSFTEDKAFLPVGKEVHFIFVSESNEAFVHAIKTVKIATNATVAFKNGDLATITKEALVAKINALK